MKYMLLVITVLAIVLNYNLVHAIGKSAHSGKFCSPVNNEQIFRQSLNDQSSNTRTIDLPDSVNHQSPINDNQNIKLYLPDDIQAIVLSRLLNLPDILSASQVSEYWNNEYFSHIIKELV